MNDDKFLNVIISSKNKQKSDTNSSMVVKLIDNIFTNNNNEDFYVSLSSFNMIKSFYACQNGLNNHFQVLFRIPGEAVVIEKFDTYITQGNYDVMSLMREIKTLTNNALFDITYDVKLNKFVYKNLFQPAIEVYIKPITAGIFMGFENGQEYKIETDGTYSSKFINISGYSQMLIKLDGDINIDNTISNVQSSTFVYDRVLAIIPLQDIAPMDSIMYRSDGSNIFRHKIGGTVLPSFQVKIVNEDGNEFPQMSDWIMALKFEQMRRDNRQLTTLNNLLDEIRFYIMKMFAYFQIPTSVTLEDLVDNR